MFGKGERKRDSFNPLFVLFHLTMMSRSHRLTLTHARRHARITTSTKPASERMLMVLSRLRAGGPAISHRSTSTTSTQKTQEASC